MEEKLKQLIKSAVREVLAEVNLNQTQSDGFPEIMDLDQASDFVHLSRDYIRNNKDELGIPHRRVGKAYLFTKSELIEWVKEREEGKQSKVRITPVKSRGSITKIV